MMETILSRSRQCCDRSAVERMMQSNNPVAVLSMRLGAIFACKLDGTLVGLRTGISKKDLRKAR